MYKIKLLGKWALDLLLLPLTFPAALWYKFIISKGIKFFPLSKSVFMRVGVLPVIDHYYYPMINPKKYLRQSLRENRILPGIKLNDQAQLDLLKQFNYNEELLAFPFAMEGRKDKFYYDNRMFSQGDAEILYSVIRHYRPRRIIEVGSGYSTLMSLNAIAANKKEDSGYDCHLTCIEPYEISWLETLGVELIRMPVEQLELSIFDQLQENDILFIDSSHVIRPQGDVLFEFLQLLPSLKKGVIVHVHDIFTPKDYLDEWMLVSHKMWNEQYLLEALLSNNDNFEILAALNYLFYTYPEALYAQCPVLKEYPEFEPRSIWIKKVK